MLLFLYLLSRYYANFDWRSATQLGIGEATDRSLFSPLARPFQASGYVAAFLHEQELASSVISPPSEPEYRTPGLQDMESLVEQISQYEIDDKPGRQPSLQTPSQSSQGPLPIPELQSPVQIGPVDTPTSAESYQTTLSTFHPSTEPVVRLNKHVWDSMGADLQTLMVQKRGLEDRLTKLEYGSESLRSDKHDIGTQIGKLRYQIEVNKDQKALMGRSLALQEAEIKKLRLDNEDLAKKLSGAECELKKLGGIRGRPSWLHGAKVELTDNR